MSNQDRIGLLYDTAGELLAVRYSIFDAGLAGADWIDAIEFSFKGGVTATLYVESDFDTLRLEFEEIVSGDDCYVRDATTLDPWVDLIGGRLSWIWILRNQQGYEDGFRFEFSSMHERPVTVVAIASGIQVFSSAPIDLDLPCDPPLS